jgi:hypothetical protein
MMPTFNPTPKPASPGDCARAYAVRTVLKQHDAGASMGLIQQTHDKVKADLGAAASTDEEREFVGGFTAQADYLIASLRDAEDARAEHQAEAG